MAGRAGGAQLAEVAAAAHHHRAPEQPLGVGAVQQKLHGERAGALPHEGDALRVAAEGRDVFPHPRQGGHLVLQSIVSLMGGIVSGGEGVQPVVDAHQDDAAPAVVRAPEYVGRSVAAPHKGAAVDEHGHGQVFPLLGGPDVQVQPVLLAVPIGGLFRVFVVIEVGRLPPVELNVLAAGGALLGGVVYARPRPHHLGVLPPLRTGVCYAGEQQTAVLLQAPDFSAGRGELNVSARVVLLVHGKALPPYTDLPTPRGDCLRKCADRCPLSDSSLS